MDDNNRKRPLSVQWLNDNSERAGQKPRVGSFDGGNSTSNFTGQGFQNTGPGDVNIGRDVNITLDNTAAEDCQHDLFITDPSEDRTALKRKKGNRAAGTCEWILETEELAAWLGQEEASNVLWLYGNPGTGKSTMAIFLTEELPTMFSKTDDKTLVYFFCDSSFDKQKTATSIVRGLLFQLVQQHRQVLSHILQKYKQRGTELFKSFDALWTVFIAAATDQSIGQTYCIIDALDECDQESQNILLHQLQETFWSQNTISKIHILITSRPYPEIREYLKVFTNKDLTSFLKIKEDINQYIKEKVTYLAKMKDYTTTVQEKVSSILKDKAESTFLWIGLACEQLEKLFAKDAIQALQQMPKGLHSLYEKLLNTAQEGSEAGTIQRILGLVAICLRPLSVLELSEACELYEKEDMETRIQFTRDQIASCRLMIIIQDEKVLLLHQSVKDYLLGAGSNFFINELEEHANMAYRCVNILIDQFRSKQSHINFLSYAIQDWANHARMAQSSFEIRDSEAEFFGVDSWSREQWLEILRSNKHYPFIPKQFSILHVAARWGIMALVDYIVSPNDQQLDIKTSPSCLNFNCIDFRGRTPIEEAIHSGHLNIFSKLLGLNVKMSERVTEAAAGSQQLGKEAMALLLDRRGNEIIITEEVAEAAARNLNKEVMTLLLDRRGNEITITERVAEAAARNSNEEIMTLLLNHRGHEITITEDVVKAAAANFNREQKVLTLLFDRRDNEITITEEIVKAIAKYSSDAGAMALLFDRRGNEVIITEDVIKTVIKNKVHGTQIMAFLLNQQKEIILTESVVCNIAQHLDVEIMALLLEKYGDKFVVTEEVLKAAATNFRSDGEVLFLLLSRRGNEITITSDIIFDIASYHTEKLIDLLLENYGDKIAITEEVVQAAARNFDGKEVIALLLDKRGNEITITEKILEAAANNAYYGGEIIALLLDRRGHEIAMTEKVISAIAAVLDEKAIELLLTQRGNEITITETALIAAARNRHHGKEVMLLFLSQRSHKTAITEAILGAAARNEHCGKEVILLLSQPAR